MDKLWKKTTFVNDNEPALSADLLNEKESALDEIDNRVIILDINKVDKEDMPFSLGIDENGNCGYIKPGEDTVTPFGSGGGSTGILKVTGLTTTITVDSITE